MRTVRLTADQLLAAYAAGVFPMAESRSTPEIFWVDPKRRGVLPLDRFHISRSLARTLRRERFGVTVDSAFAQVVSACADRPETWINPMIQQLYGDLFELGSGHSVEVWEDAELVGGVYGVALGGAFFGESMFSRRADASKVALAHLVDRLRVGGFTLFDTQFLTEHLARLGAVEIPRKIYHARLAVAMETVGDFDRAGRPSAGHEVVQRSAQTS